MFSLSNLSEKQKQYWSIGIAFAILVLMFLIAFFSSKGIFSDPGDSGTVDEIAHIPSGYTYVKDMDYRLNPEHPPLAKALSGAVLVLKGFKGPESEWPWQDINQWESGWSMLYRIGNDPAEVLMWARLPMMLLMIFLGIFLYKWARELFGRKIGLVVLAMFAFYPDILGHGRLVTTDVAAAVGYVLTIYYFNKLLQNCSWKNIGLAALALALAQLLKFSAFLLFGILFLMVVLRAFMERDQGFWKHLWFYFKNYFAVCFLSIIIVWIVYIPFVWKIPTSIEHILIERNLTSDPRTLFFRNFLHHFEGNVITRALGHYILGFFLVVARVGGGNATFALGHVAEKSISWFFPFAWIIKTPITVILLTFAAIIWLIINKFKSNDSKETWIIWIILFPIIVYWAFTLNGSLNIGIRHLMPTVPFVLLLIGWFIHSITKYEKFTKVSWSIVGILLIYMMIDTLSYFPNYIAYFNSFVPRDKRYQYLVDSSLDWGQDILRLKKYVNDNHINKIKIDYFGGSVPSYYLPDQYVEWHSSYGPTTGWLAISATYLQSSKLYGPKEDKWSYGWLDDQKPAAIIGGSILVYHITNQDLLTHPAVSPYPITKFELPGSIKTETQKVGL